MAGRSRSIDSLGGTTPRQHGSGSGVERAFEHIAFSRCAEEWEQLRELHLHRQEKQVELSGLHKTMTELMTQLTTSYHELSSINEKVATVESTIRLKDHATQGQLKALMSEWEANKLSGDVANAHASESRHRSEVDALNRQLEKEKMATRKASTERDEWRHAHEQQQLMVQQFENQRQDFLRITSQHQQHEQHQPAVTESSASPQRGPTAASPKTSMNLEQHYDESPAHLSATQKPSPPSAASTQQQQQPKQTAAPQNASTTSASVNASTISITSIHTQEDYNVQSLPPPKPPQQRRTISPQKRREIVQPSLYRETHGDQATDPSPADQPQPETLEQPAAESTDSSPFEDALGFEVGSRRESTHKAGILVLAVSEGSLSWKAGLRPNDVMLQWGATKLRGSMDLRGAVQATPKEVIVVRVAAMLPGGADVSSSSSSDLGPIRCLVMRVPGAAKGGAINRRKEHYTE